MKEFLATFAPEFRISRNHSPFTAHEAYLFVPLPFLFRPVAGSGAIGRRSLEAGHRGGAGNGNAHHDTNGHHGIQGADNHAHHLSHAAEVRAHGV